MDSAEREEFDRLASEVSSQAKDISLINTKLDLFEKTVSNIETAVQNSMQKALDIQFTKMRDYISSAINDKFKEQDYKRLLEKEETAKDYKKHGVKAVIQWVVLGVCAFAVTAVIAVQGMSNSEKQVRLNAYEQRIIDLENKLNSKGE